MRVSKGFPARGCAAGPALPADRKAAAAIGGMPACEGNVPPEPEKEEHQL